MYVTDAQVLGDPGLFGFVKKAISTVGKILTGEQTVKLPPIKPTIVVQQPQASLTAPAIPTWVWIAGAGLAAVAILPNLLGRRR